MKLEDFDARVEAFLNTLEPNICREYWCSRKDLAETVLEQFRKYMYADRLERNERFVEFLKLKAEFEPNNDRNEDDV
jgi:hypothetical protein